MYRCLDESVFASADRVFVDLVERQRGGGDRADDMVGIGRMERSVMEQMLHFEGVRFEGEKEEEPFDHHTCWHRMLKK